MNRRRKKRRKTRPKRRPINRQPVCPPERARPDVESGPKTTTSTVKGIKSNPSTTRSRWGHLFGRLIVLVSMLSCALGADESFTIKTSRGQLFQGIKLMVDDSSQQQVVGFLGVRYASAPTKRLRFMPPTPFNYAPNQLNEMHRFGPICMQRLPIDLEAVEWASSSLSSSSWAQMSSPWSPSSSASNWTTSNGATTNKTDVINHYMLLMRKLKANHIYHHLRPIISRLIKSANFEQSEDCLNLNIFVPMEALRNRRPQTEAKLLPVLVLVHGDSFDFGSGNLFDVRRYVNKHRQIVVTLNYRLNILGFPPAKWAPGASNLGLLDQLAALHWIRANIHSFGGSSADVSLLGVKRGAVCVHLLMLSPLAKGLFKRAILEDGSGLSPMIANQHQQQHQTSRQFDYLRLLAKLADCPVANGAKPTSTSQTNNSSLGQLIGNSNNLQAEETSSGGRAGAGTQTTTTQTTTTFECLKQKPIEQIMQRIPLELLQSSESAQASGKWQRAINLLFSRATLPTTTTTTTSYFDNLNRQQLKLLINLSTREQLEQSIKLNGPGHLDKAELAELEGLFNAIYSQQGPTMRPLFGPHLDSTIIESGRQQLDLAGSMLPAEPQEDNQQQNLQRSSLFGSRDLLIGVTHLLVERARKVHDKSAAGEQLAPSHLLDHHYGLETERRGLNEEQAVGQVNTFVRSFYRYHQQEISNSIVEHYLTGSWRASKKPGGPQLNDLSDPDQAEEQRKLQHQIFLFESLLEAFKDALVNVPVLKTALIHSVSQLESVAEVFVGQQYKRMTNMNADNLNSISENNLLAEFVSFASRLFEDVNWPLEVKHNTTDESPEGPKVIQQPHSTYLYQSDVNVLLESMRSFNSAAYGGRVFAQIKSNLDELLVQIDSQFKHQLGLSCSFELVRLDEQDDEKDTLIGQVRSMICSKLGQVLANFVATGNVNKNDYELSKQVGEKSTLFTSVADQVSFYETNCLSNQANFDPNHTSDSLNSDHHSVNPMSYQEANRSSSCKSQLDQLTLNFIRETLETDQREANSLRPWKVFNVFNLQIATLANVTSGGQSLIQLDSLVSQNPKGGQQTAEDGHESRLLAKSSFWSNFVQALNCSKTQPLNLMSPFPSSNLALNSSLLNLNLLSSNCQTSQAKTVNSMLANLSSRMKRQLLSKLSSSSSSFAANNREDEPMAKRMSLPANQQDEPVTSSNNAPDNIDDSGDGSKKQQASSNSLNGSLSLLTVDSSDHLNSTGGVTSRMVHSIRLLVGSKHTLIGLLTGSLLIGFVLVTGAYAFIRYRRHYRAPASKEPPASLSLKAKQPAEESNSVALTSAEQQLQARELTLSAEFLPTTIQWTGQPPLQQEPDKDVQVCASHSSTLNTSTFSAGNNQDQCPIMLPVVAADEALDDYLDANQLPVLSSTCDNGSIRHQPGCSMFLLSSDGLPNSTQLTAQGQPASNNGRSSSETKTTTTDQSNSLVSIKKRVKISDPLGATRTLGPSSSSAALKLRNRPNEQLNYCPVHRAPSYQGVQFVDQQVDPFAYYQPSEWPSSTSSMLIQRPQHEHLAAASIDLLDQQLIKQNQLYHRSNLTDNHNQTMTLARNIHRRN